MKKKIFAMVLSMTLAFSLAACGSPEVSGPVDREPVTSAGNTTSDESSAEGSSTNESSSALADWYNGDDRKNLEDTINQMYASSGMTFSISIEEPGTIIYNYQYTETMNDGTNAEELYNYLRNSLDAQYQTFVDEIQNFKDAYGMPLTTLRLSYLDADGTDLCTMDFTEEYVPSTDGTSSSGVSPSQEYASLEDWISSDEQNLVVSTVNSQLEPLGLSIDIYAEGNVMVMDYTYTEQQDLEGLSQEDIASVFDEQVVPTFSSMVASMFDSFENSYGLVLDDIKLLFHNADGTELYTKYFSEI